MIPILYEQTERSFRTNGLGGLPHWLEEPLVTHELNGEYSFAGVYATAGQHFDRLACERIVLLQPAPNAEPQPFRICRVNPTEDGRCAVEGEHVAYAAKNALRLPGYSPNTKSAQAAILALFDAAATLPRLEDFSVTSDITLETAPSVETTKAPANVWELLTKEGTGLLALFGGELELDYWSIRMLERIGRDTGQVLRWGKDIVAISAETDSRELVTAILPYYCKTDKDSSTGAETTTYLAGSVAYAPNSEKLSYVRMAAVDHTSDFSDDNPPTAAKLTALGAADIAGRSDGQLRTAIELETIPAGLRSAKTGDTLGVEYPQLQLEAETKIVKTVFAPMRERYTSMSIGSIQRNAADTIARLLNKL